MIDVSRRFYLDANMDKYFPITMVKLAWQARPEVNQIPKQLSRAYFER